MRVPLALSVPPASMPFYTVSERHFFRETGVMTSPGDTIELPADVAERYAAANPGLLQAARENTQGEVGAVRIDAPAVQPTKRKVRVARAKK